MAFLLHLGIALLVHIVFLDAALLLIFVDWKRLRRRSAFGGQGDAREALLAAAHGES